MAILHNEMHIPAPQKFFQASQEVRLKVLRLSALHLADILDLLGNIILYDYLTSCDDHSLCSQIPLFQPNFA